MRDGFSSGAAPGSSVVVGESDGWLFDEPVGEDGALDPAVLKALGAAVRELRARREFSQESLGFRAGMHRNYVGSIERGEQNVTFRVLLKLVTGFARAALGAGRDVRAQSDAPARHRAAAAARTPVRERRGGRFARRRERGRRSAGHLA